MKDIGEWFGCLAVSGIGPLTGDGGRGGRGRTILKYGEDLGGKVKILTPPTLSN